MITPGVALNSITQRGGFSYPATQFNSAQLGPELIIDGDFSQEAGWTTIGAGWTIVANQALGVPPAASSLAQDIATLNEGSQYLVILDMNQTNGAPVKLTVGGNDHPRQYTQAGIQRRVIIAGATLQFALTKNGAWTGVIDNVSMREVIQ